VRKELQTERGALSVGENWPVYGLYGFRVASDYPFANRLAKTTGEPDLTFRLVDAPPIAGWEDRPTPAHQSLMALRRVSSKSTGGVVVTYCASLGYSTTI
jgi:hypothetical protein